MKSVNSLFIGRLLLYLDLNLFGNKGTIKYFV